MGRSDERNVLCAHSFQGFEDIRKLLRRDSLSALRARNLIVWTERATQITARKKDRTASVFEGNARFFKGVQIVFCDMQSRNAARPRIFQAVCAAFHGAKFAIFKQMLPFVRHNWYYTTNGKNLQACMYAHTELVDKCRKKGYNDSPDEKSEDFLHEKVFYQRKRHGRTSR